MDTGDTAWVLTSAALVLLMTPGLALFYGGMVRAKSVLNMMMMSFGALALIGVLWVLYGYSEAFGDDVVAGLVGNPFDYFGLEGLMSDKALVATIPSLAFVGFQAVFAIITVALISGAIADRARFGPWLVFAGIWATIVYFPVAHWVFAFDDTTGPGFTGGWIANKLGAIDFAGGTAVHINAGAAGLALAIVLGRRVGWKRDPMRPHNLPLVMIGAGLLWFGWFGFNAGSALGANTLASVAWINTMAATAAAALGWLLIEKVRDGHATSLGAASGVVAGLVAITPSCSSVSPVGALILGFLAGILCALAVGLKFRFGFDDSLDVVGVHLVGGLWGTLGGGAAGHGQRPRRRRRTVLRWWLRPAREAGRGRLLGAGLLLRGHLPARPGDPEDHRLPARRGGRGRGHRRSRARRVGVRLRHLGRRWPHPHGWSPHPQRAG